MIYVIAGSHGQSKIGISANPEARLRQLQTGSPYHLWIAHCTPPSLSAFDVEQHAHALLSAHRASGEWFATSPNVAIGAVYAAAERLGIDLTASDEPQTKPSFWRTSLGQWILFGLILLGIKTLMSLGVLISPG